LNALGRHLLLELFDCDFDAISNLATVKSALVEAAKRAHATIVDVVFHEFNPFGISGVVVIAESHLSIHTWPEHRYAAVDIFSCGDVLEPEVAANYLVDQFGAERTSVVEVQRGLFLNAPDPSSTRRPSPSGEGRLGPSPMINPKSYKWFFETTTAVEGHMHAIVRTIVEARTKFQHVEIMETASYGKALVLDGRIQSSQADEFLYHEALVQAGLPPSTRPRERPRHRRGKGPPSRDLALPVDQEGGHGRHDAEVVSCASATARDAPGLDDPRTIQAEDARGYLERTAELYPSVDPWSRWRKGRPACSSPASSTDTCVTGSPRAEP
jgi:S-adenosylmethionine decarboxylase proenzyme